MNKQSMVFFEVVERWGIMANRLALIIKEDGIRYEQRSAPFDFVTYNEEDAFYGNGTYNKGAELIYDALTNYNPQIITELWGLLLNADDIEAYEKEHPEVLAKPENKEILDLNNPDLPVQLKIAAKCWIEFVSRGLSKNKGSKEQIIDWLKKEYPAQTKEAIERITTIVNPNPKGGSPKTPTNK